jgi:hypothetical protein
LLAVVLEPNARDAIVPPDDVATLWTREIAACAFGAAHKDTARIPMKMRRYFFMRYRWLMFARKKRRQKWLFGTENLKM